VPIVVFGSTVVLKLVERFPLIIHAGAAVLAFTAAKMIVSEPLLEEVFDESTRRWAAYGTAVVGVLAAGWWTSRRERGAMTTMRTAESAAPPRSRGKHGLMS